MPKGNRYDAEHLRNISSYLRQIDEIYKAADEEAARIVKASGAEYDPDKVFSFDDYPSVRKRVDRMTSDLASRVERTIVNGIKAQWELSNRKNDDLVETVTGLSADEFPDTLKRRYFATNESARDAFIKREREGMDLSTNVWKRETELSADLSLKDFHDRLERGMTEGMSADEMSRELRDYLKHPDRLFRRVQDERGVLTISRNAAVFHPGRGVYRSSYMNARRLAATETNMAYRSADHERWKSLDFVVGIEIQTSNNHTTKDSSGKTVELEDICDTLAGRYPKGFKFVGWHPHCRCIATTILKTEEEMEADTERMLNGEEPLSPETSRNYEGNLPENFTKWLDRNSERIENAKSLPYFLADNEELIDGATGVAILAGATATTTTTTPTTAAPTANGGIAQPTANPAPTAQQGNTDIIELDKNVPNWTFKGENTKDGLWARVKYFDESLECCYGKNLELLDVYDNATREGWMNEIRDIVKKGIAGVRQSDYDYAKDKFRTYMQGAGKCVADSINHLQELRKITTKDIPEIWRAAYNDAIKDLNAYDFSKGYFGVYTKIEKAYNIYKLAGLDDVQKLGYKDVSVNTPYNFFTEYVKAYPDWINQLPPKEFFDAFSEFVPLVNGSSVSQPDCYVTTYKYVQINLNDTAFALRIRSEEKRRMVIPHEFGHAFDAQNNLSVSDVELKSIFDSWKVGVGKDNGATLEAKIVNESNVFYEDFNKRFNEMEEQKNDLLDQGRIDDAKVVISGECDLIISRDGFIDKLAGLSDCLQAAVDDHRGIEPGGHRVEYFTDPKAQLQEFFAHCCENYFGGNDVFERLQPELYEEMCRFIENKMMRAN